MVGGWQTCAVRDSKHRKANVLHMSLHPRTLEPVIVLGEVQQVTVEAAADSDAGASVSEGDPPAPQGG